MKMLADIIFNRLEECGNFLAPGADVCPFRPVVSSSVRRSLTE
jgi:hypothetical protein